MLYLSTYHILSKDSLIVTDASDVTARNILGRDKAHKARNTVGFRSIYRTRERKEGRQLLVFPILLFVSVYEISTHFHDSLDLAVQKRSSLLCEWDPWC